MREYSLDTEQTKKERLALLLGTIPMYIINDKDYLKLIKNSPSISNLMELNITDKIDFIEDILYVWLAHKDFGQHSDLILLNIDDELKKMFDDENIASKFYTSENRIRIKQSIEQKIKLNKKKVTQEEKYLEKFESIKQGLYYTEFEMERNFIDVTINSTEETNEISLMDMFNDVKLNEQIPFATIFPFYKILKTAKPAPDWKLSSSDFIIFKTLDSENIIVSNDDKIHIEMSIKAGYDKQTQIENFLNVFVNPPKIETITDEKILGVFYLPNHDINKFILADLIMNNPLFSSILSVDEREQASTIKTNIYIHFNHPVFGNISANITKKYVTRSERRILNNEAFQLNEPYIRIKISRSKSIESIKKFAEIFSKLMILYDDEYEEIVRFYNKYIEFPVENEREEIIESKILKDLVPDLFLDTYTKKCGNPPEIIYEDERTNEETMVFPKDGEPGTQNTYVCRDKIFKYPGLRNNPLINKDKYPMLPCCYKESQSDIPNSLYNQYYHGVSMKKNIQSKIKTTITSLKFSGPANIGILPKSISNIFRSTMRRKGTFKNKSSFLGCVLFALGKIDHKDEKETTLYVNKIRKELATDNNAALCKQENYENSIEEIKTAISSDIYFDPKRYIRILEETYDVKIYLFSTEELIIPRHVQVYYEYKTEKRKSIFILEHMGSDSDNAEYPQCEIIASEGDFSFFNYVFPYNSEESKIVRSIYDTLRKTYLPSGIDEDIDMIQNIGLVSQKIDSYGKTRGFLVKIKHNGEIHHATILTTPLQPILLPENNEIVPVSIGLAVELMKHLNIKGTSQTINNGFIIELSGIWNKINVNIPIIPIKNLKFKKIPEKIGVGYINVPSKLSSFSRNKKLAQLITEMMLYEFSKFLAQKQGQNFDELSREYFDTKTIVIPNFSYENIYISKFFNNINLLEDEKLILSSNGMKKKLKYILNLAFIRNEAKILSYKDRTFIENYYISVLDFDQYQNQIILEGRKSIEEWITDIKKNKINDSPIQTPEPYFFSNPHIKNGKIFLAQNTDIIEKAFGILKTWKIEGYNIGKRADEDIQIPFTLVSFVNSSNIEFHDFGGEDLIMGYKINGIPHYTSLLS